MFNIPIYVFDATNQTCNLITNTPSNSESTYEVHIGLIMQYHFVGLDKMIVLTPFFCIATCSNDTNYVKSSTHSPEHNDNVH